VDRFDSIAGCLVAGAIGDGLGGPFEGRSPPIEIDAAAPLRWSDDTQLTIATCEAIIESQCVDPAIIAARFVRWHAQRRLTGLGASTLKALQELAVGQHWALAGAKGERAAGNGAAMRIAPLAFYCDPAVDDDRTLIRHVCRITHHHEEAYVAALAVVAAVRFAVFDHDRPMRELPGAVAAMLPDSVTRDRLREMPVDDIPPIPSAAARLGTSGYGAESVPFAIVGASHADELGFEKTIVDLIQCGGDTDTIASMAGQIVGARIGWGHLPRELVDRLDGCSEIVAIARAMASSDGSADIVGRH